MKFLVVSLAALCGLISLCSAELSVEEEERIFDNWCKKHKIKVPHDEAYKKWKENVIKRLNKVEEHNEKFRNGEAGFEQALNHMSHLHPEEFKATKLGCSKPKDYAHAKEKLADVVTRPKRAADDIPAYWNWADKGIIYPPPFQQCSDCYAFATTGVIEAHACKYYNQCVKLSEQESLECSDKCDGGWDEDIYKYSKENGGLTRESDHEYTVPKLAECASDIKNNPRVSKTKVVDYKIMPNDTYTIMHHLYNKGPMFIVLHVDNAFYHYSGGIYDQMDGGEILGAHAIMLVGYGTQNGTDYWIVRNSWGQSSWGIKGYGYIKRGIDLATIESNKVSYPILE